MSIKVQRFQSSVKKFQIRHRYRTLIAMVEYTQIKSTYLDRYQRVVNKIYSDFDSLNETNFVRLFFTRKPMADSSQFSPLTTLSEQLGPNSWGSSVLFLLLLQILENIFS